MLKMSQRLNYIRNIVYDDTNIVSTVSDAPQTYNTILQEFKKNGSMRNVLRRRFSRLVKQGKVWKVFIPGTRFGVSLFLHPDPDYNIIVRPKDIGVDVFYFFEFEEDDVYLEISCYWSLNDEDWDEWAYHKKPLFIKKVDFRGGGFRFWQ